jgi:hypothetical protein
MMPLYIQVASFIALTECKESTYCAPGMAGIEHTQSNTTGPRFHFADKGTEGVEIYPHYMMSYLKSLIMIISQAK